MNWIVASAVPSFFWTAANLFDEYLARHHFTANAFMIVLMATVLELVAGGLILLVHPSGLDVMVRDALMLALFGMLPSLATIPYMYALQKDSAALAVPLFQLIPVFVFVIGWFFLGETVSLIQLAASAVIIMSAFGLSWNFKVRAIGKEMLGLMILSSFIYALFAVGMRYQTNQYDWLVSFAWGASGAGIGSLLLLGLVPAWRRDTCAILRSSARRRISIILLILAFLEIAATGTYILALSLAPAAGLVQAMNGLQPFYVFAFSAVLGILLPRFYSRIAFDRLMVWRLACITVLFAGVAVLSLA